MAMPSFRNVHIDGNVATNDLVTRRGSQESPKEEAPPLASLKKGLKSATKAVGHVELLVHVLEDRDLDPSVPSGPRGPRVSAVVSKWSPP